MQILERVHAHYSSSPHHFEGLTSLVARRLSGPDCTRGWVTKRSGDGGIDFVSRWPAGTGFSTASLVVLGQATVLPPESGTVSGTDLARVTARLQHGWLGVFVTTEPAQDGYPIVLINGQHLAQVLQKEMAAIGLALEMLFEREAHWYTSNLDMGSGILIFVMAVTYTGERQWTLSDGNELWIETARWHMTMLDFPILYYDVRHCEPQDLPDTAELRIMMEGERELQHHTLYGHKLARELQLLEDPESRDVLARFLAEFSDHWPRHISQPDGTLQLVEVKWDRVQTAEDYLMATSVYSDAFSRLRQDLREEVREEVREGLREEVREEALREGRQEDALKILGTVLEQDQLASLARAWRQSGWFPNLDAVLAVRDGTQSWTFLLPTESPSASNNS